jgi:hypothetical protein
MSNAFRELAKQRPAPELPADNGKCRAENCPCLGSMSLEGGRFVCVAHAFAKPDDWPELTHKLNHYSWLIAFIDDLPRVENKRKRGEPGWREYATQFWTGVDPECLPHAQEQMLPYQNRMRGELLYRCGQSKRPEARIPKPIKSRGNAAALLGKSA